MSLESAGIDCPKNLIHGGLPGQVEQDLECPYYELEMFLSMAGWDWRALKSPSQPKASYGSMDS